jgi:hypothetical protein
MSIARQDNPISSAVRAAAKEKGGAPEDARRSLHMLSNNTYPTRVYMSPAEWATVLPNPRQRDTERHARRAEHLKTPHPIHAFVSMAQLPDGRRYKLDGHTRSYLWEKGEVSPPEILSVECWQCDRMEQVKKLYSAYDNSQAVENTVDRMFGAYREHGLTYTSPLLSSQKIAAALRIAYQTLFGQKAGITAAASEYDLISYWRPELDLLDEAKPISKYFPTGITAGSLITLRRYGPDAVDFWSRYSADRGNKIAGERDPVQALRDRVDGMRGNRQLTSSGNISILIALSVSAFSADRRGQIYKDGGGVKPVGKEAMLSFLTSAKNAFRTWS